MPKGTRCLFVDDYHIAEMRDLTRRMNPAVKHTGNPLLLVTCYFCSRLARGLSDQLDEAPDLSVQGSLDLLA